MLEFRNNKLNIRSPKTSSLFGVSQRFFCLTGFYLIGNQQKGSPMKGSLDFFSPLDDMEEQIAVGRHRPVFLGDKKLKSINRIS
jgi:hypothetical protein